jgi:hypothetical protein
VLAGAMNGEQNAAFQPLGLLRGRRLEGLPVGTEPDLDNVVAAHTRMHATSNGFNLWQFGHFSIVRREPSVRTSDNKRAVLGASTGFRDR